nr:hypothetical protein [Mycoplasmopsis bovis]
MHLNHQNKVQITKLPNQGTGALKHQTRYIYLKHHNKLQDYLKAHNKVYET